MLACRKLTSTKWDAPDFAFRLPLFKSTISPCKVYHELCLVLLIVKILISWHFLWTLEAVILRLHCRPISRGIQCHLTKLELSTQRLGAPHHAKDNNGKQVSYRGEFHEVMCAALWIFAGHRYSTSKLLEYMMQLSQWSNRPRTTQESQPWLIPALHCGRVLSIFIPYA